MLTKTPFLKFWSSLGHIATHAGITLLALGIAFSLPQAATFILFNWWPKVRDDTQMLVVTEISFAAMLVALLNLAKLAWRYRQAAQTSAIASLVYAREGDGRLSRWLKDNLLRDLPWKRDLTIMAVTGYGTFAALDSALKDLLADCYEIRVMLLNPYGPAADAYAASHADPEAILADIRREACASVACLRRLQGMGKNVALKFYDEPPFWKLVFAGEHVWVRSCHGTRDIAKHPEYVFALQPEKPNRGFFPSFYTYFLNQWNDPRHPDYAFDTGDLVYRDGKGAKLRRVPFPDQEAPCLERAPAAALLAS
ncbi:MAG: hypothetical protein PHY45_00040 [Rhodocyclaceae bacterium]|nr:hypothetical protein [Rhodocyclaceae bacterium]